MKRKKKLLIVVDYQNDFVVGSMGFPAAEKIEDAIAEKITEYRKMESTGQIIFTMDTHDKNYSNTYEGKVNPVEHCIDGLDGWQLYGKVAKLKSHEDYVFSKNTYGSLDLGDYLRNREDDYFSVEFAGVITNICVISNVIIAKTAMPNVPIYADTKCMAGDNKALEKAALDVMKSIHVNII